MGTLHRYLQNIHLDSIVGLVVLSSCVSVTSSNIPMDGSNKIANPSPSSTPAEIALQTYASSSGFKLNWNDRRPIGMLFLAPVSGQGAVHDGFAPADPEGFLPTQSINLQTSAGLLDFQNKILAYADTSIGVLNTMNAQGAITWDLEGEKYPQDVTYIGDPTQATSLAPEWTSLIQISGSPYQGMMLIDAYFKKFRDAGLKTGVTLRPQTLEFNNPTDCALPGDLSHTCQPFSIDQVSQTQSLQNKITYAKQRWGTSIFYVDSNVLADQYWNCWPSDCNNDWTQCPSTCPNGQVKLTGGKSRMGGNPLDSSVFENLQAANPDVLIIPEHHWGMHDGSSRGDYFKSVAPLYQLFQDFNGIDAHTPDDEYAAVPGAFSSIIINNAGMSSGDARYQQLVTGVSRGDILLARAWYSESDQTLLRSIYNAASAMPGVPKFIPGTSVKLMQLSRTSAVLAWNTHDLATSQVLYGTSSNYSQHSSLDATLVVSHRMTLTNLSPGQTYHFSVHSIDAFSSESASEDFTFTTVAN